MYILGIETSCDETSVSIVEDGKKIIVNEIYTQKIHEKFGGVVPEVASRNHIIKLFEVLEAALSESQLKLSDIDAVAVTQGPGLLGALLVGLNAAKSLAYALDIPLIPVNHIEAHLFANILTYPDLKPPFLGIILSGGHTTMVNVSDFHEYKLIGETRDDAIGESFDKVAKLLGLGYPGGPIIDKLAKKGDENKYEFPIPVPGDSFYDFSFSGLKSAVRRFVDDNNQFNVEDVAASFQKAAVEAIILRLKRYIEENKINTVVAAGGVAANSYLRSKMKNLAEKFNVNYYFPPLKLCTDNAAMIASLGYYLLKKNGPLPKEKFLKLNAKARMDIY
ncbi:MAG: tRNA (adenosine(37)-N6)-threonylcarbamoyltransferase complex transferase subunit TsaD [Candidatus Mcinerneyibacterium aminivorans]|uniref:tRNA N6-adenosine threonylcarbamoyltransferase n=1 Tax=Candidatus Mcinerneyibacterium aminivorans TaxID=2703815 RepID=A0A5D0MGK0_9BACT|nr:MAG: tRNA (adenosine(37)-N6)-threonylcarbamoyltransferase complex transferase subunit TsaD [Candidatus Mcinerneyibacterium aminivorans]